MPEEGLKRKEHLCRELIELTQAPGPEPGPAPDLRRRLHVRAHLPLLQYGKRAWEAGDMPTEEFQ